MNTFKKLFVTAIGLQAIRQQFMEDEEATEYFKSEYSDFENEIESAYFGGNITASEHDELACIAFYDYDKLYAEVE